jgi:hypothetical protein
MVYKSSGFVIAAFQEGKKVWKKNERELTSSSQEGWVKGK